MQTWSSWSSKLSPMLRRSSVYKRVSKTPRMTLGFLMGILSAFRSCKNKQTIWADKCLISYRNSHRKQRKIAQSKMLRIWISSKIWKMKFIIVCPILQMTVFKDRKKLLKWWVSAMSTLESRSLSLPQSKKPLKWPISRVKSTCCNKCSPKSKMLAKELDWSKILPLKLKRQWLKLKSKFWIKRKRKNIISFKNLSKKHKKFT